VSIASSGGGGADDPPLGRARFHGQRALLAVLLGAYTYVLFPASPAVDFPIYEVGSVAADNVIAPFAFRVLKADAELQDEQEAFARAVAPVYRHVPAAFDSSRQGLEALRTSLDDAAAAAAREGRSPAIEIQGAAAANRVTLTTQEAQYLANPRRRNELFTTVHRVFDRWLAAGVAPAGALDNIRGDVVVRTRDAERRVASDSVFTFPMLIARARVVHPDPRSLIGEAVYLKLLGIFFHPTLVPDNAATEVERAEARRGVPAAKYEVRAGEKIVGSNEVVGREEHEKLRALYDAVEQDRGPQGGARRIIGAVLFNFLLLALLGITLHKFRPQLYADYRALVAFSLIAALVIGGGAVVGSLSTLHPELVPVALGAVLISALFDPRISMIAAMVLATLIGGQSVFRGTNALFINLIGGAVAAFSVRTISRRNQAYQWIVTIAAAYVITAVVIGLTLDRPFAEIADWAGYGTLNAFISVLLAILLLPIAEAFTGVETELTLLEWSDLNRPLMQRLSLEAPGTYAHTIAIANLAEAACRAIGANALLARVGAYYHDIGKIARPQYFVENQARGRNPHDALAPSDSATIIRDHVSAGIALAEAHRIPRTIRAFITTHHGTGSIAYFLEKAKSGKTQPIDAGAFVYPGPLPRTAETAVVMLADSIEAATRVLHEPTADKIREVVNHLVRQRIDQGQLAEAPLTLRQIEIVKDEFTRVLAGMFHNRIDYPVESGGVSGEFTVARSPERSA
jgi:putative nucleotidyltransferase with HDIG domain